MEMLFFFSSRRRHTRCGRDWSSDVCSSDLVCACLLGLGKHNQNVVLVHIGPIAHDNFLNRSGLVKLNGIVRSEERRVGKECSSRTWRDHYKEEKVEELEVKHLTENILHAIV